jgi:hypothetical protein
MGVRPREKTPKIKAFMDKLTMLKNKKQCKGLLTNVSTIEFLKIEISDLRKNLVPVVQLFSCLLVTYHTGERCSRQTSCASASQVRNPFC